MSRLEQDDDGVDPLGPLYAHKDTLQCAINGCIVCCYKFVVHKEAGMVANQRPENCMRAKKRKKDKDKGEKKKGGSGSGSIGVYEGYHRILTVGDGNFSFSLSLARQLHQEWDGEVNLVATSHESRNTILKVYPDSKEILNELEELGAHVFHDVDATQL